MYYIFNKINLVLLLSVLTSVASIRVNIGAIFEENDSADEAAFYYAINQLNSQSNDILFNPVTTGIVPHHQPFTALKSICSLVSNLTIAVFGPKTMENIDVVQSVCDAKEIPHFLSTIDYRQNRDGTIINVHPHFPVLSKSYIDIIEALEWTTFTILYEDNESLVRVANLIRSASDKSLYFIIKQLKKHPKSYFRDILKDLRSSGQKNFVIDCKLDTLEEVLVQAQQMGLMTHEYRYFITNLDAHTMNLKPFQFSESNITGIRLLNPDRSSIVKLGSKISKTKHKNGNTSAGWLVKSQSALIVDAVTMLYYTLLETGIVPPIPPFICDSSKTLEQGYSLVNAIKTSTHSGLSGFIRFDNEGYRSHFELEVFEITEVGVEKIATWNSTEGLNLTKTYHTDVEEDGESLQNKTFIVITCLTDPYGMLKETAEHLSGNNRFEGFGIDLIHELSVMEGFNYTFIIRHDKKNGARDPVTGKWSGMIGDLKEYRADLAITDLTITSERETAVDFTSPFMNLGISILFMKPKKAPPNFFSFADPFAIDTWLCLAVAYTIVSLSLFIMGRLCPDEWTNPFPCVEDPEFLVNQFSFRNSIWFTIGSLMQQGTEIAPIAISTRMVAGMWWFFVLIMVSSYTANLAAFLTNENAIELFSDIYTLVENSEKYNIRYGAKANGATAAFFRDSLIPLYQRVHEHMVNNPDDMVIENKDGVELAERENYAFFMESTSIEYETQRHCDLMQYGKLLDDKGYGIAMRKNSPYRKRLSTAVLKLQSSGKIANLKRKWWEERRGGGACSGDIEVAAATPLDLKNVEGVFYVTIFGVIAALILVCCEMMLQTLKRSMKSGVTFKEAFKIELKSYLNFNSNVKPTATLKTSDSKSTSASIDNSMISSTNNSSTIVECS